VNNFRLIWVILPAARNYSAFEQPAFCALSLDDQAHTTLAEHAARTPRWNGWSAAIPINAGRVGDGYRFRYTILRKH
jgi:hypothetical protein